MVAMRSSAGDIARKILISLRNTLEEKQPTRSVCWILLQPLECREKSRPLNGSLVTVRMREYTTRKPRYAGFQTKQRSAITRMHRANYGTSSPLCPFRGNVNIRLNSPANKAGAVVLHSKPDFCYMLHSHKHTYSVSEFIRINSVLGSTISRKLVSISTTSTKANRRFSFYNLCNFCYISKYRQFCRDIRIYSSAQKSTEAIYEV